MILKPVTEIRDPVHGYIKITEVEREVIDSPFLQRLRRIHQLAGAFLVYPGAVHTRFDHVLGAMNVAGSIGETLVEHSGLEREQVQELRLAALLHDVGHGPFSHTFDEVLAEKTKITHEDISQRLVSAAPIKDILEKHGYSSRRLSDLCVGRDPRSPRFMNEIIAGALSADIMDYLLRDSYFTGVEYGRIDIFRLIFSLYTARKRLVLDKAALYAFEAMLLARYQMFTSVYFHRTARAAQMMVARSMTLADGELGLTDLRDLSRYLRMTDELVLQGLASLEGRSARIQEARRLAEGFRDRKLAKCVYEKLVHRKGRAAAQAFGTVKSRDRVVDELSKMTGVDRMHIYLDVPTTPSVPHTPSRELLESITTVSTAGKDRLYETRPIAGLPLAGSISGYMDLVRVYARPEERNLVSAAATKLFGREAGPLSKLNLP